MRYKDQTMHLSLSTGDETGYKLLVNRLTHIYTKLTDNYLDEVKLGASRSLHQSTRCNKDIYLDNVSSATIAIMIHRTYFNHLK